MVMVEQTKGTRSVLSCRVFAPTPGSVEELSHQLQNVRFTERREEEENYGTQTPNPRRVEFEFQGDRISIPAFPDLSDLENDDTDYGDDLVPLNVNPGPVLTQTWAEIYNEFYVNDTFTLS